MNDRDLDTSFMTGDVSKEACGYRIGLAVKSLGVTQLELSRRIGVTSTTLNNMVKGRQIPSTKVMHFLNDKHGIDYNFVIAGIYKQLPHQVVSDLFETSSATP